MDSTLKCRGRLWLWYRLCCHSLKALLARSTITRLPLQELQEKAFMCQLNQAARCFVEIFYPVYLEVCFTSPHKSVTVDPYWLVLSTRFDDQTHFICWFSCDGSLFWIWDVHLCNSQSTITLWYAYWCIGIYDTFIYVTLLFLYHVKHVSRVTTSFEVSSNDPVISVDATFLCYAIDLDTGMVHMSAAHDVFSGFE